MPGRRRHPKKQVEKALVYAEEYGWMVTTSSGRAAHAWGMLRCPDGSHRQSIYSTPRSADNLAKLIRRAVIRCPHGKASNP
jgi:hypothetical protein